MQQENEPTEEQQRPSRESAARPGRDGFFRQLGPGLITGAADDDPSGISTYSVTGAAFGYGQLWTALFSFPMMAAVQMMCARLGMVTGFGLAGVIRRRYPPYVLWSCCLLLIVANIVNIGADLKGMGEAMEMMTGIDTSIWVIVLAIVIAVLMIWTSYRILVRIFKWLTLVLLAYVVTAFLSQPDWTAILKSTFVPHVELTSAYLATFIGILGTTISPYLFFWQAAQEVEEEVAQGRTTAAERRGATDKELKGMRRDVMVGMAFSNLIMYFIILTTGATLHAHGMSQIETARDAALALKPLAGNLAYLLFTVGLIGTGMLGVPVLAGSAAYAIAEAKAWRGSLDARPNAAPQFYIVFAVAMIAGVGLNYLHVSAIHMLFIAAVLNGLLAPPLVAVVTLLTSSREVMGDRVSPPLLRWLGWITTAVMGIAGLAMIVMAIVQ
ncbi:MAG: Nramp family divalent metal transporter [Bacteroidetes bacterium]|nr:Nramp family divalent metal transporter [Bacteroidota bacterium]